MAREISAGGVLVRRLRGRWYFAAIRPRGRGEVWALPKGLVDPGEAAAETALREAEEETGLVARLDRKLGDVKYVYTRRGSGERVFKIVSFYLLRYRSGRIGNILPAMKIEVAEADRRGLAVRAQLVGNHRRVEVEGVQSVADHRASSASAASALPAISRSPP